MIPYLPEEILIKILSKLPPKSIGKCRCVSKTWRSLLSSTDIGTHEQNLILISPSHSLHTIPTSQIYGVSRKLDIFPDNWTEIVGSCNGLVLLVNEEEQKVLVNPVTLQHVNIPDSPVALYKPGSFSMHGFGYDFSTDDYKIVTLSHFDTDNEYEPDCADTFVDVYSVKSAAWKRLESSPYDHAVPDLASGSFVNDALHWLASSRDPGYPSVIAAFSLAHEVFDEIPAPRHLPVDKFVFNRLAVGGGRLCMIDTFGSNGSDIWMMKEYGDADSWTKISITCDIGLDMIKPLCFLEDEEVVLQTEDDSLVLYDPKSSSSRDIVIDGVSAVCVAGAAFVETLIFPFSDI